MSIKILMPYVYSGPYVYSFCQIFQALHLFPALRLFRTLKYNVYFSYQSEVQIPSYTDSIDFGAKGELHYCKNRTNRGLI